MTLLRQQLNTIEWKKLIVPLGIMAAFWALAIIGYISSGWWEMLLNFGYLGTALGVGLGLYATLPKKKKPVGRRVALLLIGIYLIGLVGLLSQNNIQITGVWFSLLAGVAQAAVIHYAVAKIGGPLLFGRLWCGWACWSVMVFDFLPFKRSPGRLPGKWGWLRFAHFGITIAIVLVAWFALGLTENVVAGSTALLWFIGGNLFYYALGIGMAYALKDNRAFCKYVCPVAVPLKLTSVFSLMKVKGDAEACNGCNACTKLCPMDVDVPAYIENGTRVLSTECTLCQTCISTCSKDALKITVGFDVGGPEALRIRN
ncbi:MAG: 4Fe-4S binding protein [Chloroflexi bacterium]|nr:4Fe-4S binding protein [Chloroflexota bacterium]